MLVEAGASVNAVSTAEQRSALHIAAQMGRAGRTDAARAGDPPPDA